MADDAGGATSSPAAPAGGSPQAPAAPSAGGAVTAAPEAAGAPSTPQRFTLKHGESTREVTLAELQHLAQKGYGAENVFREAAEVRKERQSLEAALKSGDPKKVREHLVKYGGDPDELGKAWVLDWYDQQQMTEEQKEAAKKAQALAEREAKVAEHEEAQKRAQFEAQEAEHHTNLVGRFGKALEVYGADPENPPELLVMLMANYEMGNRVSGVDAPPEVIAAHVAEQAERIGLQALQMKAKDPKALCAALGDEMVNAILNHKVAEYEAAQGIQQPAQTRPQQVNGTPPRAPNGQFRAGIANREDAAFKRFIGTGQQ